MIDHGIDTVIAERFVGRKYYQSYRAEDTRITASSLLWEDVISVVYDEHEEHGTGFFCVEYSSGKTDMLYIQRSETAKSAIEWFNRRAIYRKKCFVVDYELLEKVWFVRYHYWKDRYEQERIEAEEGFHPSREEEEGHIDGCVCEVCMEVALYAEKNGDLTAINGYSLGLENYHCQHSMTIEEYIEACGHDLNSAFADAYREGVDRSADV